MPRAMQDDDVLHRMLDAPPLNFGHGVCTATDRHGDCRDGHHAMRVSGGGDGVGGGLGGGGEAVGGGLAMVSAAWVTLVERG